MKKTFILAAMLLFAGGMSAQKEAVSTVGKQKTEQAEKQGNEMRGKTKEEVKEQKRKGASEMSKEAAKDEMDEARKQAMEERERVAKQHGTELAKSREEAQRMLDMSQEEVDKLEIEERSEAEQIRMAMQLSEAKFKLKNAEDKIAVANKKLEKMQSLPDSYTEEEIEAYKKKIERAEAAKEALKEEIKKNNRMLQRANK